MELVAQHEAHKNADFTFEIDEYRDAEGHQMLLAHIRVHRWNASVLKRLKREWAVLRRVVIVPLFASPMVPQDAKWVKFVTILGFKPFSSVLCQDGMMRPLFIHRI